MPIVAEQVGFVSGTIRLVARPRRSNRRVTSSICPERDSWKTGARSIGF